MIVKAIAAAAIHKPPRSAAGKVSLGMRSGNITYNYGWSGLGWVGGISLGGSWIERPSCDTLGLAHARDERGAEQKLPVLGRIFRDRLEFIEARAARRRIAFL